MAPTLPCNHPLCYLLLLLLLLLKPVSSYAQTSGKLSLGSSLTAQKNDSFWASPSGDFAFGFQQIGNGGFLLAIWFNKVPEKTIIWSANSDNPTPRGSKVELTTDGEFILNDQKGKQMWKADLIGPGVAYAAMLDTGNFVLASQNSTYLWESFNHPTDTILPTQILEQGSKLVARYSETNYSRGKFMFSLQTDGNLVLYTTDFPMDSANFAYWESDTVGSGFLVIFNQSGNIYLIGRNGSILNEVLPNKASTPDFYQRGILEYDGFSGNMSTQKLPAQGLVGGPVCLLSYLKTSAQQLQQGQAVELAGSTATVLWEMIRGLIASAHLVTPSWIRMIK
ncbi:G-type lectin S-receptor-like serine/threonine-protein kinase LECRK2 [Vitis vinifera]|uniref:G-type lectin S-receptor-like serine/threonine-protein kinase LECRK2 n=1 Tax=Vitis vinifera TaxID=29760 RepID=A0A438JV65_VITVI|nr:G-type lectin S-receptor-like serine/threonine-protein kinase LECRK2 [Vitis vinifera]